MIMQQKKRKPRGYCPKCGEVMTESVTISTYDPTTGRPKTYKHKIICENARCLFYSNFVYRRSPRLISFKDYFHEI